MFTLFISLILYVIRSSKIAARIPFLNPHDPDTCPLFNPVGRCDTCADKLWAQFEREERDRD